MKYSTVQKKKLRLQGHRKRRKVPVVSEATKTVKLDWIEYKTLRQFQSVGDAWDIYRTYGTSTVRNSPSAALCGSSASNGYDWVTRDR